jgi:hypothetical protein
MSVLRFEDDADAQESKGKGNMDKHVQHAKRHAIRWTSKTSGRIGTGTNRFSKDEAEKLAAELNEKYPDIEHEVVLVAPSPAESVAVLA